MPALRIVLLRALEVSPAPGEFVKFPTKKAQALLAYLGCRPGMVHEREKLVTLLWGERDGERARNSLRQTLFRIRRALGNAADALIVQRDSVTLVAAAVEVDVPRFERLIESGQPAALREAVDLYGGDLLDGFALDEAPFEEWLRSERERLRDLALDALALLLQWQSRGGESAEAIRTARRLLALDPWREPVVRTLMRLLCAAGQARLALRAYAQCHDAVRRDLDVAPEPETVALFDEIRAEMGMTGPLARGARPALPAPRPEAIEPHVELALVATPNGEATDPCPPSLSPAMTIESLVEDLRASTPTRADSRSLSELTRANLVLQRRQIDRALQVTRLNRVVIDNLRAIIDLRAARERSPGRAQAALESA